ncbi:MAG: hypothetical protein BLITH_1365 [Brockia lithotrophica]|uniref:Uncharacterized protein n=1 Tax=Brockia lithotrophica TaxID=933949 RepID=A0A2T5G6B3_9BACL|nr:MAG: hypothetical protein BLITH_1365 [Brockia lithotrophica]
MRGIPGRRRKSAGRHKKTHPEDGRTVHVYSVGRGILRRA